MAEWGEGRRVSISIGWPGFSYSEVRSSAGNKVAHGNRLMTWSKGEND
jgi:hypothetical protein